MNQAKQIMEDRVNGSGVTEATVVIQGTDQIVVSIPGGTGTDVAKLGKAAVLNFRGVVAARRARHLRRGRSPRPRGTPRRPRRAGRASSSAPKSAVAGPARPGRRTSAAPPADRAEHRPAPRPGRRPPPAAAAPPRPRGAVDAGSPAGPVVRRPLRAELSLKPVAATLKKAVQLPDPDECVRGASELPDAAAADRWPPLTNFDCSASQAEPDPKNELLHRVRRRQDLRRRCSPTCSARSSCPATRSTTRRRSAPNAASGQTEWTVR